MVSATLPSPSTRSKEQPAGQAREGQELLPGVGSGRESEVGVLQRRHAHLDAEARLVVQDL